MSSYHLGAGLAGLLFAVLGVVFLLDAVDVIAVRAAVVLPAVVIVLGIAVVMNALWQRDRGSGDGA